MTAGKRSPLTVIKKEGLASLTAKVANELPFSFGTDYIVHREWSFERHPRAEDLYLTEVQPNQIKFRERLPFALKGDKAIIGEGTGSWDRCKLPFECNRYYRSLKQRYVNGESWEETEVYQWVMDQINHGESGWNGSMTVEQVHERCEFIDRLYESIRASGYRSQADLADDPNWETHLKRVGELRIPNEMCVAVDRHGDLIQLTSATHRLSIVKMLELDEKIPAIVQLSHSAQTDKFDSSDTTRITDHPLTERVTPT